MSPPQEPLRVLLVDHERRLPESLLRALSASAWGPFVIEAGTGPHAASGRLLDTAHDAVLLAASAATDAALWPGLSDAALHAAIVVVGAAPGWPAAASLMRLGVQDVLPAQATDAEMLGRALRLAVERKRIEQAARRAYATDLPSGLPSHTQLLDHMNQLLALREREPVPMALLVLRVEGLRTLEADLGRESAQVVRRKVAVRLRAGVRASDVVAALGAESFAVLLSAMESATHAQLVCDKLLAAMRRPFSIGGREVGVAVAAGAALYPAEGTHADALLRLAVGNAALNPAVGRAGFANRIEGGGMPPAANDES